MGFAIQKRIGGRLRLVRETANWTQDQLAAKLSLKDRQTISDIENGKRKLRPEELLRLCDIFDKNIEFFIDPFTVLGEAQFSWRATPKIQEDILQDVERKADRLIGLLRWLYQQHQNNALNYQPRLPKPCSYEAAQQCAEDLVLELNLGTIPAKHLLKKVEHTLKIPVLFVDITHVNDQSTISGVACHLEEFSVILINRNESESRRLFNLAHELFHILTWDTFKPSHQESNVIGAADRKKRIEELANNFASALLMPQASIDKMIDKNQINNIAHLVKVAQTLRVSCDALAWRLFNLKKIDASTRKILQTQQVLFSLEPPLHFSNHFMHMLHQALEKGDLSARKAANLIHLSLDKLQALFSQYGFTAPFEL